MTQKVFRTLFFLPMVFLFLASSSRAAERLCDASFEDCRAPLLALINNETVAIDTAFWFSDDTTFSNALIAAKNRGVKIRVLMDTRAEDAHPQNTQILQQLVNANIPMRERFVTGILHWKMMMFASQGTVEFSGANFSVSEFRPYTPFVNYTDEAIYFSDDPAVVNSFKSKFDDWWTDTVSYRDYNPNPMVPAPTRSWGPAITLNPELNFPPSPLLAHNYGQRMTNAVNAEKLKLDIDMFRITNAPMADNVVKALNRGVAIRMIVDTSEYRNTSRFWDAYNVDRLYMAGVPLKITAHQGQNHEKALLFYGQKMTIFGSSNWSFQSANSQQEHNYFTKKPWFFQWFANQFERRWNSPTEYKPFVPLGPGSPTNQKPLNAAVSQPLSVVLTWEGGPFAHKYDVYFGTASNPPLIASDITTGAPQDPSGPLTPETYKVSNLAPGTTYFWRVIGKTMANIIAGGPTWSFTTKTVTPPGPGATVSAVSPNTGPSSGGTPVTITGTNFAAGAIVSFDLATAAKIVVVNGTTITATTPAHVAGTSGTVVNVTVTNKAGDKGTLPGSFTYSPPAPVSTAPKINVVSPSTGSPSGGDAVTITGRNFVSGLTVTFGGVAAVVNSTSRFVINLTTPAGSSGAVPVVVKNPDNQTATGTFTYAPAVAPSPSVSSVSPPSGSSGGGTAITIGGSDFVPGDSVTVGGKNATTIIVVNSSTMTANTPPNPLGAADVVVTRACPNYPSCPSSTLTGGFTYTAPPQPSITSVSPNSGTVNGGTTITINGANFQYGATVTIGGRPATVQTWTNGYMYATTPTGQTTGTVDVVVTNPDNQSVTLTGGFTYN